MNNSLLIYQDKPRYAPWFKWLIGYIVAFPLIIGLAVIPIDIVGTYVCLIVTAIDALIFWAVIPRSYQIYEDKLRIQLGKPLAINIPLESIKEINKASAYRAFVYWGMRFSTATSNLVEIKRRRRMNIIISPYDADTFIKELTQARKSFTTND